MLIVPSGAGNCNLQFTATDDYGANMTSTDIVNIQFVGAEPADGAEVQSTRSGGSSTNTQIIAVPIEEEVDKPVPIKLISPGTVTTYANRTIYIPLKIKNTWTTDVVGIELSGVALNATMFNENNVTVFFEQSYFGVIPLGGEVNTVLEIANYRREGPFEIVVYAKVGNPEFTDSTTILISSLEQTSTGSDVTSKVTFAKDMLSENPVCRELNDLLDRSEIEARAENYDEALKLVDGVINGCKYLMKGEESRRETPSIIKRGFDISREYSLEIVEGAVILLILTLLFYVIAALRRKIIDKSS
jgi:hypothetical protein